MIVWDLYLISDAFLTCFSVVNPASIVKEERVPELKEYTPNITFLLIGTQIDLQGDPETLARMHDIKEKPVCVKQGQKLAKETGACCCVDGWLEDYFCEAIIAILTPKKYTVKK